MSKDLSTHKKPVMIQLNRTYYFIRSLPRLVKLAWCLALHRTTSDRACIDKYVRANANLKNAPFFHFLHYLSLRNLGILNFSNFEDSGELGFVEYCLSKASGQKPVVIDIGANQGQFANLVLSADTQARVISFEPNPQSANICSKNLMAVANKVDRFTLIRKAVSNFNGSLTLYDYSEDSASGHASVNKEIFNVIHNTKEAIALEVECTTLDRELEDFKDIKKVCLFKFDIEGHEFEAIQGALKVIKAAGFPPVLIEFNEMNAILGTTLYQIRKTLGTIYSPYRLLPKGQLLPLGGSPYYDSEIYAYQNIVFVSANS